MSAMNRKIGMVLALLLYLSFFPVIVLAGEFKVTRVYDGDTILVEGHDIFVYVLLAGIDAPEIGSPTQYQSQPFAAESRRYLESEILNKTVDIRGCGVGPYPYNHLIGEIYHNGKNINVEMLKKGLAEVCREDPPSELAMEPYFKAENEAKASQLGIWSLGEKYVSPFVWRRSLGND